MYVYIRLSFTIYLVDVYKRMFYMIKVGITCYPTIGGSGIIATELGKLLAENERYEVHFITSSLPFRLDCVNPGIYFHERSEERRVGKECRLRWRRERLERKEIS